MDKKALVDKITRECLVYMDVNSCIPLRDILNEVTTQMSYLAVMMNAGFISKGAQALRENRTTLHERLRLKGQYGEDELRGLCELHNVRYFRRPPRNDDLSTESG